MKNKRLLIVILFLVTLHLWAQNPIPRKSYFHFTGNLGEGISVTMEMVKLNDSIYADYSIHFTDYNPQGLNIYYGNSRQLAGKMSPNNGFILKEPFSSQGPVIHGKFINSSTLSGNWETSKGKKFPFRFTEHYPEGSVQFNLFSDKASKKLINKQTSPKAVIDCLILLPGESSNSLLSDSLRTIMQHCFFGSGAKIASPEVMIEEMKTFFFENYTNSNESLYKEDPDGGSFNWELLKYTHILYNDKKLLSFYNISYAFTGGAHGLETHDFYSVDLIKGQLLHVEDMIKPGFDQELSRLLTNKLKLILGLSETQKLSESGYFTDEVKPNENFYVTANGIGFFYNHYELAPYSFGFTDIFLSFDELKSILK